MRDPAAARAVGAVIASGRLGRHAPPERLSREADAIERLLLRYDDSGRLAALPRLLAVRVAARWAGDLTACLDAATAGGRASGDLWIVHRASGVPDAVQAWVDRRLEPGRVEEFHYVYVERRQPRPAAVQPGAG